MQRITKTEYFLTSLLVLMSAQAATFLENKFLIIAIFIFTILLYLKKYYDIQRFMILFLSIWIVINLIAYFVFENLPDIHLITFFSVTARMLIPYLIIRLYREKFFTVLERILYFLTLISIPLYIIQLAYPSLFFSVAPYLNFMTMEEQKNYGGWYIGVYMFNSWSEGRNSGFMWEPGAFAFMLIIGLIIHLSRNRMKIDTRAIVYIGAVATTLSTMGYAVTLLIILSTILKTERFVFYIILIPIFVIITFSNILQLDFMLPKVQNYAESAELIYRSTGESGDVLRINRFGILAFAFDESLKWPWGYGVLEGVPAFKIFNEYIEGPNTYAQILLRWGFLGIVLYVMAAVKFINVTFYSIPRIAKFTLILAFLSSVSSYSLLNNSILLAMLYFPFVIDNSKNLQHSKAIES